MGLWVLIGMLQPARLPYLRTMLVGDRGRHFRMGGGLLRSLVAYGTLSMSPPAHALTGQGGLHSTPHPFLHAHDQGT